MDRMSKKRFNELNVYLSKKLVEICKIKKIHKTVSRDNVL